MTDWTCGFCGGPDSRHRTVDAQMERVIAGESMSEVAADWGLTSVEMVEEWAVAYGRAFDGWRMSTETRP